jgi:hypothetical protein
MKKMTLAVAISGAGLLFAGCGSTSGTASPPTKTTFALGEFAIVESRGMLYAGRVAITANNVGDEVHELVIVRAPSAETLPR